MFVDVYVILIVCRNKSDVLQMHRQRKHGRSICETEIVAVQIMCILMVLEVLYVMLVQKKVTQNMTLAKLGWGREREIIEKPMSPTEPELSQIVERKHKKKSKLDSLKCQESICIQLIKVPRQQYNNKYTNHSIL